MCTSFSVSDSVSAVTGTPVHLDTTAAMSSPVIVGVDWSRFSRHFFLVLLERLAQLLLLVAQAGGLLVLLAGDGGGLVLDHLLDLDFLVLELGRRRRGLQARARAGLVDEVDGLVGQEALGDVAVGELGGGAQRAVVVLDLVVRLVLVLEALQDRERLLDGRRVHDDGLEAALERGVALDVLAVLVERGRADALQLAARQARA